jgi:hypothetical protein
MAHGKHHGEVFAWVVSTIEAQASERPYCSLALTETPHMRSPIRRASDSQGGGVSTD